MWSGHSGRGAQLGAVAALMAASSMFAGLAFVPSARAAQLSTVYSFCAQGGPNCSDGALPASGMIIGAAGHLFGTTVNGGSNMGGGTVFRLIPDGNPPHWTFHVLYNFCQLSNCADGANPYAGLLMDPAASAERLYGTTSYGGVAPSGGNPNAGTVFLLSAPSSGTQWALTTLFSFCSLSGCLSGGVPMAGVIADKAGDLYGTASILGRGKGVVFRLHNPGAVPWLQTVLYNFCEQGGTNCADGAAPLAGLVMDGSQNLYGTASSGGKFGNGVVFELTHNAKKTIWKYTVLYDFCQAGDTSCTDGAVPKTALIFDAAGNLYGTTSIGVTKGQGTVFELSPNAAGTAWSETVLYSFCQVGGANCDDGANPEGVLIMDAKGHLFGTTELGGSPGGDGGTVFELAPNASNTKWTHTSVRFCQQGYPCLNGTFPVGGVVMGSNGSLYGTTENGGAHNFLAGTVFEIVP